MFRLRYKTRSSNQFLPDQEDDGWSVFGESNFVGRNDKTRETACERAKPNERLKQF